MTFFNGNGNQVTSDGSGSSGGRGGIVARDSILTVKLLITIMIKFGN